MAEHESNTQRLSAHPRGLPGFLRRSLRYPEAEDELDSTSSGGESNSDRPSQQLQLAPDKTVGKDQTTKSSDLKQDRRSLIPPTNNSEVVEESRSVSTASIASDSVTTTTTTDGKPNDSSVHATDDSDGGDRSKSYKEKQFEKVITAPVVNMRELRNLGWNGIPAEHRAQAWKILLGYLPANQSRREQTLMRKRAEYRDAIAQHYDIDDNSRTNQEQETLRQVLVDVPRTAPEVGLFRNDRVRQCLSRLLYIWAMRHPASSYVQGINDLATPLISVFLSGYYDGKDVLNGEILNEVSDQVLVEVSFMMNVEQPMILFALFLVHPCFYILLGNIKAFVSFHRNFLGKGGGGLLLVPDKFACWNTGSLYVRSAWCAADGYAFGGTGESDRCRLDRTFAWDEH
jgi:hypothetical protein